MYQIKIINYLTSEHLPQRLAALVGELVEDCNEGY